MLLAHKSRSGSPHAGVGDDALGDGGDGGGPFLGDDDLPAFSPPAEDPIAADSALPDWLKHTQPLPSQLEGSFDAFF